MDENSSLQQICLVVGVDDLSSSNAQSVIYFRFLEKSYFIVRKTNPITHPSIVVLYIYLLFIIHKNKSVKQILI